MLLHSLMAIPAGVSVGLTSACLGLVRSFDRQGIKVGFFKPISQPRDGFENLDLSTKVMISNQNKVDYEPISMNEAQSLLSLGKREELLEKIVARFRPFSNEYNIVIVEGVVKTTDRPEATRLNLAIADAINAEIVLITSRRNLSREQFEEQIINSARIYGGIESKRIIGCIINKVNAPIDAQGETRPDLPLKDNQLEDDSNKCQIFQKNKLKLLGKIPWDKQLIAPRISDICEYLDASYLFEGEAKTRRFYSITLCGRSIVNVIDSIRPGCLIITSGDRADIIMATCMAAQRGIQVAGLLLTGGFKPEDNLLNFCKQAIETGLPIIITQEDNFRTSLLLHNYHYEVPLDDTFRIEKVKNYTARHINTEWIKGFVNSNYQRRLSPAAFRHSLIQRARANKKKIVLPEGDEPRTIEAAIKCSKKNIADCILLGNPQKIEQIAIDRGLNIPESVQVVDPNDILDRYITPLADRRKHKGLTHGMSKDLLQDTVTLGTMMLEMGDVDGLVSGAVHTTANTIRPALQLIKTSKNAKLVSSVFFMCLPEQVLVYGDCAVNTSPNAEQLADIAIQSADSAKAFGIEPLVAMISYSTGNSGSGVDVEKVSKATKIVKEKRPDLTVEGPMQYDAAINKGVAKQKAPNSLVAGNATVIVFPDLNTGNTTYKAVQRSADLVSIGPMLQGLNKPVNDLSRGALVEDIIFTIAITAIQASYQS